MPRHRGSCCSGSICGSQDVVKRDVFRPNILHCSGHLQQTSIRSPQLTKALPYPAQQSFENRFRLIPTHQKLPPATCPWDHRIITKKVYYRPAPPEFHSSSLFFAGITCCDMMKCGILNKDHWFPAFSISRGTDGGCSPSALWHRDPDCILYSGGIITVCVGSARLCRNPTREYPGNRGMSL
jgi:hypothetical protein